MNSTLEVLYGSKHLNTLLKPKMLGAERAKVRIVSFNAQCAKRPDEIARAITKNEKLAKADIILLQETEHHEREGRSRAEVIASHFGYECVYSPARSVGNAGTHGLAVLSRLPLESTRIVPLGFCDLGWKSRARIGVAATLTVAGEQIRIYNIHLDTRINASTRIEQLRPVLEDLESHPADKAVLAGDFNMMPIRWMKGMVPVWYENQRHAVDSKLLLHGFTQKIEAKGHTMRSGPIRLRLDSIYAKGCSITSSGIERDVRVSDHLPLWADVEF